MSWTREKESANYFELFNGYKHNYFIADTIAAKNNNSNPA